MFENHQNDQIGSFEFEFEFVGWPKARLKVVDMLRLTWQFDEISHLAIIYFQVINKKTDVFQNNFWIKSKLILIWIIADLLSVSLLTHQDVWFHFPDLIRIVASADVSNQSFFFCPVLLYLSRSAFKCCIFSVLSLNSLNLRMMQSIFLNSTFRLWRGNSTSTLEYWVVE